MTRRGGASRFRIRILPSVLLTAAILLLPALLYAWGRQSDSFEVGRIQVTGTKRIAKKEALRLLRADYLGHNLFTVTREDVHATLDKLPYLAAVTVDREFPTTLRVRIVEYRPAAYVLSRDHWYVVSDTGHVIDQVGSKETTLAAETGAGQNAGASTVDSGVTGAAASGDAVIDGVAPSDVASPATPAATDSASPDVTTSTAPSEATLREGGGDGATDPEAAAAALGRGPSGVTLKLPRIGSTEKLKAGGEVREEGVRTALTVLAGMPTSLRQRVEVIDVQPGDQVTLALAGGLEVEVGSTERLVAKVLSLRAVLQAYESRGRQATFVDVSIPDRPLARPRLTP